MVKLGQVPRLAPLAAAMLGVFAHADSRADWSIRPGVEVRETYTDNVALQPEPRADGQFVTEINPTLRVDHKGPRLTLNANARLNYFIFGDKQVSGTNKFYKQFSGSGRFEAIEDTLFVEATGFYGPRAVSPFGQQLTDNLYANANRAQISSWSIAPYVTRRFGNSANLLVRYMRDSIDTGSSGFGTSDGDSYLFNLASGPAFNTLAWNLRLTRQDILEKRARIGAGNVQTANEQDTSSETALASLRYRLTPGFSLTSSLGYDNYDYAELGGVTKGRSWSGGFAWAPSLRTSLEVSAGKRYIGSSKSLLAQHRSRRTTWKISYSDSVNNMRSNSLLPATFDTAATLDRLFLASIPDDEARRLQIERVMLQANLPASLTESISFLSNRYFLQKQLTGSMGFKLARTTGLVNVWRTRNDALTTSATDSGILGSTLAARNDNTRQEGASMTLTYAVSPRSNLRLTRTVGESLSLTDGRATFNRSLRLTATRSLSRQLIAGVELRNIHGSSISTNYLPYREKAVAAYLSYQR